MVIPDWIDQELWEGFLEERQKKKNVNNTPLALKRLINKLKKFKAMGLDPNESLEESYLSGWDKLYPVENQRKSLNSHNTQNVDDWVNKGPSNGGYTEEQMRFEGFARTDDGSFGESETSH